MAADRLADLLPIAERNALADVVHVLVQDSPEW
jgi:hypothetical protein